MSIIRSPHSFHIPVMGTSFTIDTPIRVAHYGISSVMSLIDHRLIEQIREYHALKNGMSFEGISEDDPDCKALRITAYLNLVADIVEKNFETVKKSAFEAGSEITKYFQMLPDASALKQDYVRMLSLQGAEAEALQEDLRQRMVPGAIDGNIMTKVDSATYFKNQGALPVEFNDAHSSLRGFAKSRLRSSIVFSAGMNPRLYSYASQFMDFFPDSNGHFAKTIILKVSDYRSALIQGKFLAKKGLWVSEFRIESGLNCGGHAFASDGYLLGPILQEFSDSRSELRETLYEVFERALKSSDRPYHNEIPQQRLTVQGGVGTFEEQSFLFDRYHVDSVGWGTPFLLVPEAVSIDHETMLLLSRALEKDLYLSNISPLGVPFNSVHGSSAELELQSRIDAGKPGAACLKKHLISNTEYGERPICPASIQYQRHKISDLKSAGMTESQYEKTFDRVTQKTCLCVGLGNAALKAHDLETYRGSQGVAVCPGPNMAYYSKICTLHEMVDHIYGRANIIIRSDRPNIFIKELGIYIDYLRDKVSECADQITTAQTKYFEMFRSNLRDGVRYYEELFPQIEPTFSSMKDLIISEMKRMSIELDEILIGQPSEAEVSA